MDPLIVEAIEKLHEIGKVEAEIARLEMEHHLKLHEHMQHQTWHQLGDYVKEIPELRVRRRKLMDQFTEILEKIKLASLTA